MAQDTLLGFPAHTLPYRRGEFTTLSTVSAELLKRSSALLYAVKNMARMEVMMPQTHRAMELMAP